MKKPLLLLLIAAPTFAQQSGMPPTVPGTSGHCPNITSTNSLADSGSQCGNVTATELQNGTYRYEVDTGTANAYAIAPSPSVSSYVAGLTLSFKVANANTGASTLNVSGLGTKTIFKGGSTNLASGDFPAGSIQTVIYDGAAFQAQSVNTAGGSGTSVSQNSGSAETSLPITGYMPQACSDSSGSGTAQSCTVANIFTPQAGNCIVYKTTTANSGTGLTVNVNSLGAKSIAVASSSGWTTTLVASSSIPANKPMNLCYDGTNWDASGTGYIPSGGGYQPSALPLPGSVSGFTWVNQGGATTSNNGNTIQLLIPPTSPSLAWRILEQSAPSTPYSVAAYWKSVQNQSSSNATGLYFYDGTKLLGLELLYQGSGAIALRVERITNTSTDGSTPYSLAVNIGTTNDYQLSLPTNSGFYGRLRNSGTTLYFDYSLDGYNWNNVYSEAVGAFITPTAYGFGGISANPSFTVTMSLSGWYLTNSAAL